MRTKLWRIASLVTLLAMLISPIGATGSAFAAPIESQSSAPQSNMRVIESSASLSQPLRSMAPVEANTNTPSVQRKMQDRLGIPKTENTLSAGGFDASILQDGPVSNSMPTPDANFEGVSNVNGVHPPDTQGDMGWDPISGTKYYVQWVNLSFQIWDVTNAAAPVSLYGPAAGNTLWTGSGDVCEANNDGDPITQFDHLANRWMMTQFALPNYPAGPFYQCVAISQTADPTGAWYRYTFKTSDTLMNDYPHFGVWPDGYYMTVNQFGEEATCTVDGWCGAGVAVFEREALLAGLPARLIYIDTGPLTDNNYGGVLPSDLDGPAPAVGTPNYFMEWDDSTWLGDAADTLRIWEFDVDWAIPANTTFGAGANYAPNAMIDTANVAPLCLTTRNCIDQPGTTQNLDAIGDRLMYRLQYRNFGTHQTIVGNHTVDAGSSRAGIHWFELRDTGTGFDMYQEGVYAGDAANTDSRWMGSIAMDASGNMALGYSVSGSATFPSIRYTGRLDTDPLNGLTQGETSLIAGTGSQTSSYARWGDYSMMAVDASDNCTFWFTTEYTATTDYAPWQTRVGSFKFPSCTTAPTGTLSGTVTDGANPIVGATINVSGGYATTTNAAGYYELLLVDGTYDVTASKYGFASSTVNGVVVAAPATTTQNFTLAAASTSTISGVVTDATAGWPLYASIEIYGYPNGAIFTDPVTGAYSVDLIDGSYTFTVSALSGGYTDTVAPVVVAGDATEDFTLAVDTLTCNVPGYQLIPGTALSSDGFDTSTAPAFSASWAKVDVSGTAGDWVTRTASLHPTGIAPHSASNMAVFNSYTSSSGNSTRLYQTSGLNLSAQTNGEVSFWMYHETGYSGDTVQVQVSTDAGLTWNNVGTAVVRDDGTTGWAKHTANIDAYTGAGMTDVRVGFLATSSYGNDVHIDDMSVGTAAQCNPIATYGLIVGAVKDINTDLFLSNAVVEDAAMNQALFIDNSADTSENSPLYIIAEPAGAVTLTASALQYADGVMSPTVVAGDVIRQDFGLDAGMLSIAPTSMTFNASGTQTATLTNDGGLGADYEIFAIRGTFAGYVPTGPFAPNTRHIGPKNLNDHNASALREPPIRPYITPLAAGDVSASWDTGLIGPWGVGFNTDANDLWLGNDDNLDYRFTTAGVNTGDTIDVTSWMGSWAADMTYNPFTNTLWQVNVGGDNCIYELDPASMVSTGNKICPLFGTSERGLAFDPLTNTYYAGSWNDFIINHFAPDGTLLSAVDVNLAISGLAFNPSTGHLFVLSNTDSTTTPTNYDVTVLDTADSYAVIGGFNFKNGGTNAFADYEQAGLEIDCAGNLWAANYGTMEVYAAASGETGVCDWQASWLSTTPISGSVAASGSSPVAVDVDTTGLAVGTYNAYLRVVSNTPYGDEILPVTLNVAENSAPVITSDGGGASASKIVV